MEFEERVILRQLEKERNLIPEKYFLDRSLVDCLGMSFFWRETIKIRFKDIYKESWYHPQVFLLSPLDGYENDDQRKATKEEMLKIHEQLRRAYIQQGFEIIEVSV